LRSIKSVQKTSGNLESITGNIETVIAKGGKTGTLPEVLWGNPLAGTRFLSILANLDSASNRLNEDLLAARRSFLLRRYFRERQKP